MKYFAFFFALGVLCLVSSIKVKSKDIANNQEKPKSLMETLEAILNDPEFVSLNPQQQLRVLVIMYEILESHLKSQESINTNKRNIK
jgi:hypothetical protein